MVTKFTVYQKIQNTSSCLKLATSVKLHSMMSAIGVTTGQALPVVIRKRMAHGSATLVLTVGMLSKYMGAKLGALCAQCAWLQ